MPLPPLEVADVFRAHAPDLLRACGGVLSSAMKRVVRDLVECRTPERGGQRYWCPRCGHEHFVFKSCGNRHCPKCRASARAEWLEARAADLLPVEYFHVVFTMPEAIAQIALQNKRAVYNILFRASSETLKEIAADPKHLGAEIGFIGLLHTWGQTLHHHPHVHYVVPGGGFSRDRRRWVSCRPGFFLPVSVLGSLFRGRFLALLRRAFDRGDLSFHGRLEALEDPEAFAAHLAPAYESKWVVYAKPPFGGPGQVLKYLAHYVHRVAISNSRLLSLEGGEVQFRYKDYAHGSRPRVMTLSAVEFMRRFLLHVLPRGFVHIRHFGFLGNPVRVERLALARELLGQPQTVCASDEDQLAGGGADIDLLYAAEATCPVCGQGRLRCQAVKPIAGLDPFLGPAGIDSS